MNVTSSCTCPGCELKTTVRFRKPSVVQPTIINFICENCKSHVLARAKRPQLSKTPQGNDCVNFEVKIIRPSQLLLDMKKEEEEERKDIPNELQKMLSKTKQRDEGRITPELSSSEEVCEQGLSESRGQEVSDETKLLLPVHSDGAPKEQNREEQ